MQIKGRKVGAKDGKERQGCGDIIEREGWIKVKRKEILKEEGLWVRKQKQGQEVTGRKDHRQGKGGIKREGKRRKKETVIDIKGEKSVLVSCASTTEVMK